MPDKTERLVHPKLPGRHIDVGVHAARVHRQAGWIDIDDASAPQPPARNARRDEWAEFVPTVGIQVAEDDSRDDLIAKYEALTDTSDQE